jgi:hypothetical protein
MLTDPTKGVTVEAVTKQLADLETNYRAEKKARKALLKVLEVERDQAKEPAK